MIRLLKNVTANETGNWRGLDYGKDWVLAITNTADFGTGTLSIELRDRETAEALTLNGTTLDGTSIDLSSITAAFAPTGIALGAGMEIRAKLTGATSPDIKGVFLYSAEET